MATKSFVGRVESDGRFSAHPVTYDGDPAGVGASLAELLASDWAQRCPSLVLAEMAGFRHWWSLGPGLDGPTRAGCPNQRPDEQDIPLITGRVGATFRGDHQWGYLFRGEDELVVVKQGQWWDTPAYPLQRWAVVPVATIDHVDWTRLGQTGELRLADTPATGVTPIDTTRSTADPATHTDGRADPGASRPDRSPRRGAG